MAIDHTKRSCSAAAWVVGCLLLGAAQLAGCAKGELIGDDGKGQAGGGVSGGVGPGVSGAGGTTGVVIDITSVVPPPSSGDAAVVSQVVGCDGGDACVCPPFNLAVLGKPGKWGANPDGDPDTALQQWLNSSSAGTARADNFTNRVTLTEDFLATYHVIILASLSDDSNMGPFWTYTDAEAAAFRAWIENGGGAIAMIGYAGDPAETRPTNQLIGFSGITYTSEGVWGPTDSPKIYDCNQSNALQTWNRSDPLIANLSTGLTAIGFTNGRAITAPADAHVAATVDGKNVLVGKLVGQGRVLAFGDEWISYTSQWTGAGNPKAGDPTCEGYLAQDVYQMSQFWYNMIRWSYPGATCFTIIDKQVPVMIW